jgi:hypothetical protein
MKDENGSIAPLGIGLMSIVLALIFILVCANSMYLLKQRLTSAAEFAALAEVSHSNTAAEFLDHAQYPANYFVADDSSTDQKTTEVTVCAFWIAPLPVISDLAEIQICGHGAARAG